jgi:V8-like Glu-specific endopeptidase
VGEYKTCVEVAWCGKDSDPAAISYIKVNRLSGGTKPGSSGSGLFNMSQQLVGTHLGGSDAASFDYYGRFDRPYRESLVRWLGGGRSGE